MVSLILVILGFSVYYSLSSSLRSEADVLLRHSGEEIAGRMRGFEDDEFRFDREGYQGRSFYLIINDKREILANPQLVILNPETLRDIAAGSSFQDISVNGEPTRVFIQPLNGRRTGPGMLIVGQSMVSEQAALQRLLFILIIGSAIALMVSFAGAWFLAGRALIPIERAFARQREFVADASHELRTPLTVVHSAVDMLYQHRTEPLVNNAELFDDLRQEIVRIERLATDLLTLASGDLNQFALAVGEVNLPELAAEVVRRLDPLAQDKKIVLINSSDGEPAYVEVDPDRLQQILLILLDNALKHTPTGGAISVGVKSQGTDVLLTVADTGEGIPPEHLPRVFDRFYRADRSRSRAQGSVGLGLAIAKSLIEAHGGHLTLSSVPGKGTTATIRLHSSNFAPTFADRVGQLAARMTQRSGRHRN